MKLISFCVLLVLLICTIAESRINSRLQKEKRDLLQTRTRAWGADGHIAQVNSPQPFFAGVAVGHSRHHIIGRLTLVQFWNKAVDSGKFQGVLKAYVAKLVSNAFDAKMDIQNGFANNLATEEQTRAALDTVGTSVAANGDAGELAEALYQWNPAGWFDGWTSRTDDPNDLQPATEFEEKSERLLGKDAFDAWKAIYALMKKYIAGGDAKDVQAATQQLIALATKKTHYDFSAADWDGPDANNKYHIKNPK